MQIVSDAFICDARRVATLHTKAGGTAYHYHFTHGFKAPFIGFGAYHAAEIAFVFGNDLGLRLLPFGMPLEAAMQGYWSQLARTGDPNRAGLPDWQPYDPERGNSIRLDLTVEEVRNVRKEACDFWDTRRPVASE
jgi:carboxylesterase type B